MQTDYLTALQKCSNTAKEESERAGLKIQQLQEHITITKQNIMQMNDILQNIQYFDQAAYKQSVGAYLQTIDEVLQQDLAYLYEAVNEKRKNLEHFTVTLFGRTKAGKSTIHQALTNGDGSTIGKGAQRTTREIFEYDWNNLRIIDTPGIGAFDGEEDVEVAYSVIERTDVFLFLVTDDSIQVEEFKQLAYLKRYNKPILILLNVKKSIESNVHRKRFLKNYKDIISIQGQAGHVERIHQFASDVWGLDQIDIIPIHAHAAFLSTTDQVTKDEQALLYEASNLETVKAKLSELVVQSGMQIRVKTFRDSFIYHLQKIFEAFLENDDDISEKQTQLRQELKDLKQWNILFEKNTRENYKKTVATYFARFRTEIDSFLEVKMKLPEAEFKLKWEAFIENENEKLEYLLEETFAQSRTQLFERLNALSGFVLVDSIFAHTETHFSKLKIKQISRGYLGRMLNFVPLILLVAKYIPGPFGIAARVIGYTASAVRLVRGNDEKVYQKKIKEMKATLFSELASMEREVEASLFITFEELQTELWTKIMPLFERIMQQLDEIIFNLQEMEEYLGEMLMTENKAYVVKLFDLTLGAEASVDPLIDLVIRVQGECTRVYTDAEALQSHEKLPFIEQLLGEELQLLSNEQRKGILKWI